MLDKIGSAYLSLSDDFKRQEKSFGSFARAGKDSRSLPETVGLILNNFQSR
jgi:hypothetical protein